MRLTTTKKKEPELFDGLENIDENKYFVKFQTDEPTTLECVADKLSQLEDIEDELGIDLIILCNVSKGIAVYNESKTAIEIAITPTIDLLNKRLIAYTGDLSRPYKFLYFTDYGKTWALTKEELESPF